MAKIVLFVDAMEPDEYGEGWLQTERGMVLSGHPKVTPKVTGEVYSGMSPSDTGMGACHSMKQQSPGRPMVPLIQEKLEASGYNVASLHMPYCLPLQLQNGLWISTAQGRASAGQNQAVQRCLQVPASGDLLDPEEDDGLGFNSRLDDMYAKSSSMLNLVRMADLDVVFIGIRSPDHYTHFQWDESYRTDILKHLAVEVSRWEENHDILWWSDHGSEEKKETFRVNKWLMDKGYLDLSIDVDFHDRFIEESQQEPPSVENQIDFRSPGVDLNEGSQAVSADPYDSCIDVLDDDLDVQTLIDDLESTGYYRSVLSTEEAWGDGQYIDTCPDIVTLRADNVLVTGNIHPEPIGMGFYRTGVHSAEGAWGTTDDSLEREGDVTPQELHDVIWEFVTGESLTKQEANRQVKLLEQQFEMAFDESSVR
jgi:hypothetical protein